jgi:hypothetical protein
MRVMRVIRVWGLACGDARTSRVPRRSHMVSVSSTADMSPPLIFDDLRFRFSPYDPWAVYMLSKTATAHLEVEATRRFSSEGSSPTAATAGTRPPRQLGGVEEEIAAEMVAPESPSPFRTPSVGSGIEADPFTPEVGAEEHLDNEYVLKDIPRPWQPSPRSGSQPCREVGVPTGSMRSAPVTSPFASSEVWSTIAKEER